MQFCQYMIDPIIKHSQCWPSRLAGGTSRSLLKFLLFQLANQLPAVVQWSRNVQHGSKLLLQSTDSEQHILNPILGCIKEKQVNDGIKGAAMSAKQPTRSGRSKVRTGATKLLYRRGATAGTAETHGRSLETIRVSLARHQWGGNIVHAF